MREVRVVAVIPARMASSRFPGKPLVPVQGLPMIEHVRRRTLLCRRFSEVVVATCDVEIAAVVRDHGGKVLMTSAHHPAATDRVAEALGQLDCSHVVNVQGDEVLVLPSDLERMVRAIERSPAEPAWNALSRVESEQELSDRSIVKCVVSSSHRLLFCSRDLSSLAGLLRVPSPPVRKVLGILGYRRDFLESYPALPRTPLEIAESIDQSRILEHDVPLQGVAFSQGYLGLNEPREVSVVHSVLREDPLQQRVLQQVLAGGGNGV